MAENRADSAHVLSGIMQDALKDVNPPEYCKVEEKHLPFWNAIIKVRHSWNELDLIHAANLARTLYEIEYERGELEKEGSIIMVGKHGNVPAENPRSRRIETLVRQSTNLSQKLQVHAQATLGNPRDNRKKNGAKKNALEVFDDLEDDDDLIARPN